MINLEKHVCKIITPTKDYLNDKQINSDLICSVPNCLKKFANLSAMKLHLTKVHNISDNQIHLEPRSTTKCDCKYYCPIDKCKYNLFVSNGNRFFSTFYSLKVHFVRIHTDKKFKCSNCFKEFGIKSEFNRHEAKCGQFYKCSCDCSFTTMNSLLKHANETKHHIANYHKNDRYNRISLHKNTKIIPKPIQCDIATQETQTITSIESIDFNCLDAATSPLMNNDPLVDIDFTQSFEISTQTAFNYQNETSFAVDREIQTCSIDYNSICTQTKTNNVNKNSYLVEHSTTSITTTTAATTTTNDFDFELESFNNYSNNQTQTQDDFFYRNELRCMTPYFSHNNQNQLNQNTNSIQTQTHLNEFNIDYFRVDNITQTHWNLNEDEDF